MLWAWTRRTGGMGAVLGRRDGRILGGTAGDMYVRARCLVNTTLVGLLGMPLAYIHRYAVICRCLRVCACACASRIAALRGMRAGTRAARPTGSPKGPPEAMRGMRADTRAARPTVWSADAPRTPGRACAYIIYTGSGQHSGSTHHCHWQ
jgi:hypothetical protein